MLIKEWTSRLSAAGLAALLAVGCSESTGSRLVTVQVSLGRADTAPSAALAPQDVTAGSVTIDIVKTLTMELDSVQLQTSGSEGWQTVIPTEAISPKTLTLDLKTDLGTPIALGTVTLDAGPCEARLFVSGAQVTFNEPVVLGQAQTYLADTPYDLRIPSGDQTGLKTDGACELTKSGDVVSLDFDVAATAVTIAATGNGSLLLTPVIHIQQP